MGKVKGKHRLDKFYHLAKQHGYRSRAAWKLVQLESKFTFLRSSNSVLDLCAAPGGWMQVCVERMPVGSLVVGVDLDPIKPIRGAISLQEDITTSKCRASVKRIMSENGCRAFDLVLHDGSPNVGGAWAKEATSQNALVIDSVKLATELLAPKGNFVTKVFRSQDYTAVLYCLRQLFEKVEVDKPQASRLESAEIYIVGFRYKAPAKIDPRLLDVKHLFQGGKELPKVVDVLRGTKQKRHRDGYEDGDTTLRKLCSASDFIWSDEPLVILGSVASITFNDPGCLLIKEHTLTTEEVKALCDDLRVLGKQDFKHLLKWRMHIRKALSSSEKGTSATATPTVENKDKVDDDERVLNEMEELSNAIERKNKRAKRLLAKKRAKDKTRKALGTQTDAIVDGYTDMELFNLSSIKGKKDLVVVNDNEYDDDAYEVRDNESDDNDDEMEESDSDIDSEEEKKRYDERIEELLDEAYESYVAKKEGSAKQRKRSKQAHTKDELFEGDEQSELHPHQDSENDEADQYANPLVVPLAENKPTQEEITTQWFSQDIFMDEDFQDDLDKENSEDEMQMAEPVKQSKLSSQKIKDSPPPQKKKALTFPESDFEVVPAPATDSSDSSSDESDYDNETKAELLACAKKMLTKKQREDMLDDAYNKYMFHDVGLPKWFADDEKRNYHPIKPVTKEEVAAVKAQFKEINARPAKKVVQAKARKKRAAQRKLEKVRKQANSISDQADISDLSKRRMIDQLYKKATPKRPEKEYVVAKKGVQVRVGKGKVRVDPRMKKDARKHGMSKQGKGKKGKGKGMPKQKGGKKVVKPKKG